MMTVRQALSPLCVLRFALVAAILGFVWLAFGAGTARADDTSSTGDLLGSVKGVAATVLPSDAGPAVGASGPQATSPAGPAPSPHAPVATGIAPLGGAALQTVSQAAQQVTNVVAQTAAPALQPVMPVVSAVAEPITTPLTAVAPALKPAAQSLGLTAPSPVPAGTLPSQPPGPTGSATAPASPPPVLAPNASASDHAGTSAAGVATRIPHTQQPPWERRMEGPQAVPSMSPSAPVQVTPTGSPGGSPRSPPAPSAVAAGAGGSSPVLSLIAADDPSRLILPRTRGGDTSAFGFVLPRSPINDPRFSPD